MSLDKENQNPGLPVYAMPENATPELIATLTVYNECLQSETVSFIGAAAICPGWFMVEPVIRIDHDTNTAVVHLGPWYRYLAQSFDTRPDYQAYTDSSGRSRVMFPFWWDGAQWRLSPEG